MLDAKRKTWPNIAVCVGRGFVQEYVPCEKPLWWVAVEESNVHSTLKIPRWMNDGKINALAFDGSINFWQI